MNDSEQKASTQDPKFMTITKFAWEEKAQQVEKLKQENQRLADLYNTDVYALESKVEEMQKNIAGLKTALDRITGTLTRDRMIDIAHDAIAEFGGETK